MLYRTLCLASVLAALLLSASSCGQDERQALEPQVDTTSTLTKDLATVMRETVTLDSLLSGLARAQLLDQLAGTGPFTVFAPTNEAWRQISARLDTLPVPAHSDTLQRLLQRHLVRGRWGHDDVNDSLTVSTLSTDPVRLQRSPNGLRVNGQPVQHSVDAQNGVLHVIEFVLEPLRLDTTGRLPATDEEAVQPQP